MNFPSGLWAELVRAPTRLPPCGHEVRVTKDGTTILDGAGKTAEVEERTELLRAQIELKSTSTCARVGWACTTRLQSLLSSQPVTG